MYPYKNESSTIQQMPTVLLGYLQISKNTSEIINLDFIVSAVSYLNPSQEKGENTLLKNSYSKTDH